MKPGMKAEIRADILKGKCFTVTLKAFPQRQEPVSLDSDRKCHWQFHQNCSACPGRIAFDDAKELKQLLRPGLSAPSVLMRDDVYA